MAYRISVPVMVTAPTFDPEKTLQALREIGAERVFLAIPPISTDPIRQDAIFTRLEYFVRWFREHSSLEVGVWFWTFWVDGKNDFIHLNGVNGKTHADECCPFDEAFLQFSEKNFRRVAAMHPDLILLDDDLRFGAYGDMGFACTCPLHRKRIEEISGEKIGDEKALLPRLFGGKKNKLRSAFLQANKESIENYAVRIRKAVDAVDPSVRIGQCACIGTFDLDGTDAFTLSKLLAGKTKPFMRQIGAPYWAERQTLGGSRLADVIDLERMERSWYENDDIEIFCEGDTYPRPRYKVPSSYLQLFDTALRAEGKLDGILRYMLDYTSSVDYERGYIDAHLRAKETYEVIDKAFENKETTGIRVYHPMKSAEKADFTGLPVTSQLVENLFFSWESHSLASNTLPATYYGSGCAGIAFGESARHLPESAFEKPLILDLGGAKILEEMGIDTGLETVGTYLPMQGLFIGDEAVMISDGRNPYVGKITLKKGAKVRGEWKTMIGDALGTTEEEKKMLATVGGAIPACWQYENKKGQRFLVWNFDAAVSCEMVWRNYCYPKMIAEALRGWGEELPVETYGNPDLYCICKEGKDGMAIGFWNCCADDVIGAKVKVKGKWKTAAFYGCEGKKTEDGFEILNLGAFKNGTVTVKK